MHIHLSCYSSPAVFDQMISYLHNPIVTLWVAWPTPTKLDCFQSTIVTLMVAQLPLQLLGIAFSSASSLWLWMSKHHNWATKTLTLCQFRPVVKVKWCQELLSKGNLCNLNFDSLSNQAHNLQYKWLPKFWLTPTSFWLLTFVKAIQKSNLDFDSPCQGWLLLLLSFDNFDTLWGGKVPC